MRTTNKVQKTENRPISKTLAIVISLVLISFTVSAQGFWKQLLVNNTYGKMAELMVEQKNADDQAHVPKSSMSNSSTHFADQTSGETNTKINPYRIWPVEVNLEQAPNPFNPWVFAPNETK
jgi:hypothetical protein